MMNRKRVLGAAALMILCGSLKADGYWADKMETQCSISFSVPVQLKYRAAEAVLENVFPLEEETAGGESTEYAGSPETDSGQSGGAEDPEAEDGQNGKSEGTKADSGDSGQSGKAEESEADSGQDGGAEKSEEDSSRKEEDAGQNTAGKTGGEAE